jgi:hypothetical protein
MEYDWYYVLIDTKYIPLFFCLYFFSIFPILSILFRLSEQLKNIRLNTKVEQDKIYNYQVITRILKWK